MRFGHMCFAPNIDRPDPVGRLVAAPAALGRWAMKSIGLNLALLALMAGCAGPSTRVSMRRLSFDLPHEFKAAPRADVFYPRRIEVMRWSASGGRVIEVFYMPPLPPKFEGHPFIWTADHVEEVIDIGDQKARVSRAWGSYSTARESLVAVFEVGGDTYVVASEGILKSNFERLLSQIRFSKPNK